MSRLRLSRIVLTATLAIAASTIGTSRPALASIDLASIDIVQAQPVPASPTTYRDPQGLFEIALPAGYVSQVLDNGVFAFQSSDQAFGGVVRCGVIPDSPPSREQLEASVKSTNAEYFSDVTWQPTQVEASGMLVMPWTGRNPDDGSTLDSIVYVDLRGNRLCMLNLLAIDRPYSDYSRDAQAILSSYRTSSP